MSESLDRRLTLRERIALKLHLAVCAWCVQYLQQITIVRKLLRTPNSAAALPASLSAESKARIQNALKSR
jgi:hypothetical protein